MKERSHLQGESQTEPDVERLSAMWARCDELPTVNRKELTKQVLTLAWLGVVRSPLTSILTVVTIGFSLFLFAAFLLVVRNTGSAVSSASSKLGVSIYIKDGVGEEVVGKLQAELKKFPGVSSIDVLTKKDALASFRTMVGEGSPMVMGLEDKNPLPQSLEVTISEASVAEDTYLRIVNDFSLSPHVESVRFNKGAFSQVGALMRGVRIGSWIGTLVMLGITGLIISNAVRLAVYAYKNEIEIMELVGATERYIRAPFLVEGACEGFVGAALGVILLYLVFIPVQGLYQGSPFALILSGELIFLGFWHVLLVLVAGTCIGLVASYLAARTFSRGW